MIVSSGKLRLRCGPSSRAQMSEEPITAAQEKILWGRADEIVELNRKTVARAEELHQQVNRLMEMGDVAATKQLCGQIMELYTETEGRLSELASITPQLEAIVERNRFKFEGVD